MKIEIQLEPECTEPKIIVVTDKVTDEINALLKRLSAEQSPMLAGFQGEQVTVLEPSQLYRVYASGGKVYAEAEGAERTCCGCGCMKRSSASPAAPSCASPTAKSST